MADLTCVRTYAGWTYAAFIIDVFARMVVCWQVSTSLSTDMALDSLDIGQRSRRRAGQDVIGLNYHSDRGAQYRGICYAERFAEAEAVASVGSKSDSYDNAMAEAFNILFEAECIRKPVMRPKLGWKSIVDVELAVAEYVDFFNRNHLDGEIAPIPPAEFETNTGQATQPSHTLQPPPPGLETGNTSLYETRSGSPRLPWTWLAAWDD